MKKKEIHLSKEFKSHAARSILAICFFILTYLIILLLAIVLTGLCIAGGFFLIAAKPMFLTIALGIGLASLGALILIFLLKFIFRTHKTDRSHLIEITQSQEPQLFEMINDIVLEVGTAFPKKVYLSSEVNASVFYDSSFWSMFLPVKKNLQIGLGLVNTVTKEELKAILAHEFGHFSQRTMKVGSYVYNVNQVIFNILFDNESYESLIQRWANVSGYISIFVAIAVKINEGIQWILRKLYAVINTNYMGLSREMEFHADEIAASITGYEPLKNSLLRMTLADTSYSNVLNFYNDKITENIKSDNIYNDQSHVLNLLARTNNLTITNKLPHISIEEQSKYDKSKLVIKDQWASHPSVKDRIDRLEKTGFTNPDNDRTLANEVFSDIAETQKQLTEKIFEGVSYSVDIKTITSETFIGEYEQQILSDTFSKIYNGYYDNKNPTYFELSKANHISHSADELFSDQKVDLVYSSIALQNDIETLNNISDNSLSIKTFDYDGVRYKKKNAKGLIEKLKSELDLLNEKINRNDIDIYSYFLAIENGQNKPSYLERVYNEFFAFEKVFTSKSDIYVRLSNELIFVSVKTPFQEIKTNFNRIKPTEENLKQEIRLLLSDSILTTEISQEIKENLEKYTSQTCEYFDGTSYLDDNLNMLYTAMHNYLFLLSRKYFVMKKALLAYQEELIKTHN